MSIQSEKSVNFRLSIQPWLGDLHSTAFHLTSKTDTAENLLKSTLLTVYRNFDQPEAAENIRQYSFGVLFDTYYSLNDLNFDAFDNMEHRDLTEFYLYKKIDESTDLRTQPTEHLIRTLVPDEIDSILNNLPRYMRLVFFLKDVQDFSYDEIAYFTRTSRERVIAGVCLGRKLLQRHLWSNFEKGKRVTA